MDLSGDPGNKPHDALFKILLAQPGTAAALLRERLPPETVRGLRTETARRIIPAFEDDRLRQRSADLVLEVETKGNATALVYALVDHKSARDHWVRLQMLRY